MTLKKKKAKITEELIKEQETEKQVIKPQEAAWIDASPPATPYEKEQEVCEGCGGPISVYCRCS
jgi:hypothetical protein